MKINKNLFYKVIIFSCLLFYSITNEGKTAKSYQITDNIYSHANIFVGVGLQQIHVEKDNITYRGKQLKNNVNYYGLIGLGYNIYFSVHNFVHPFIGLDLQGKMPFSSTNYMDNNTEYAPDIARRHYHEAFLTHLKLGAKLNISDVFAVMPYALIGFNVSRFETKVKDLSKSDSKINISVGFGGDVLIYNRFIIALEYRYAMSRYDNTFVVNSHNFAGKFGIEFL